EHASACLVSANFVCRASILRELGGFSPQFLRDEDRELNLRMWRAGKRGIYDDSVIVYAQVQAERLTRRYHRSWHDVTGQSHGRPGNGGTASARGRPACRAPDDSPAALGVSPGPADYFSLGSFVLRAARLRTGLLGAGSLVDCNTTSRVANVRRPCSSKSITVW